MAAIQQQRSYGGIGGRGEEQDAAEQGGQGSETHYAAKVGRAGLLRRSANQRTRAATASPLALHRRVFKQQGCGQRPRPVVRQLVQLKVRKLPFNFCRVSGGTCLGFVLRLNWPGTHKKKSGAYAGLSRNKLTGAYFFSLYTVSMARPAASSSELVAGSAAPASLMEMR